MTFRSDQIYFWAMLLAVFERTGKLLLPGLGWQMVSILFKPLSMDLPQHIPVHSKRPGSSPFNSHGFVLLTVGGYCVRRFSCCALIITISSCSCWALAVALDTVDFSDHLCPTELQNSKIFTILNLVHLTIYIEKPFQVLGLSPNSATLCHIEQASPPAVAAPTPLPLSSSEDPKLLGLLSAHLRWAKSTQLHKCMT